MVRAQVEKLSLVTRFKAEALSNGGGKPRRGAMKPEELVQGFVDFLGGFLLLQNRRSFEPNVEENVANEIRQGGTLSSQPKGASLLYDVAHATHQEVARALVLANRHFKGSITARAQASTSFYNWLNKLGLVSKNPSARLFDADAADELNAEQVMRAMTAGAA